jgi:hypothetical protein
MSCDLGVVYVASKLDRYVEEAFLSALSVKQHCPGLPVTLFTDRPEHELCLKDVFDCIRPIVPCEGISSRWAQGQLNRLACLPKTPYMRTLHLDTDTRILSPEVCRIFQLLGDFDVGMVETALDDSFSRVHLGCRVFNAGLVLYRRSERVWDWLESWRELSEMYFRAASKKNLPEIRSIGHVKDEQIRRKLLCMDQTSLSELLGPEGNAFGLRVCTLAYSWNYRGSQLPQNNAEPIKILHWPRALATSHSEDLATAMQAISNRRDPCEKEQFKFQAAGVRARGAEQ